MKTFLKLLLAMGLVVMMAAPSLAGLAVDFSTPGDTFDTGLFSVGFQFTPTSAINVTALGYYDAGLDGLAESHAVGIFDVNQNLLVSTTVTAGAVDPLTSSFRMHTIAPTLLAAGQTYYIAGVTGVDVSGATGDIYTTNPTGFVVDPSITFVADAFSSQTDANLNFPDLSAGVTGWFGPNFVTGTPATPVPVPPTVLLLGSGLLSLVGLRRFRKS